VGGGSDGVLTDRGTEYSGEPDRHEYELYLAAELMDHTRRRRSTHRPTASVLNESYRWPSGRSSTTSSRSCRRTSLRGSVSTTCSGHIEADVLSEDAMPTFLDSVPPPHLTPRTGTATVRSGGGLCAQHHLRLPLRTPPFGQFLVAVLRRHRHLRRQSAPSCPVSSEMTQSGIVRQVDSHSHISEAVQTACAGPRSRRSTIDIGRPPLAFSKSMKAALALLALCALLVGLAPRALAQDDDAPSAPAPGASGGPPTGPAPRSGASQNAPAAGPEEEDDSTELAPPQREGTPPASDPDPYAREPYESEPSEDEGGADDGANPKLAAPTDRSAPTHEPHDPYAVDPTAIDPYDVDGD
jgi:hypothetical protein